MTIPVWLSFDPANRPEDKWDSHGVRRAVDEVMGHGRWQHMPGPSAGDTPGNIVVLAAGANADAIDMVNQWISDYEWLVLILTADEQGLFPMRELRHSNMRVWRQTPHPTSGAYDFPVRFFGYEAPDRALQSAHGMSSVLSRTRKLDWSFMGQVTHLRRKHAAEAMLGMGGGLLLETNGFAQGFDAVTYYRMLADTKIAVCPSGATTPDTFRFAEAIEMGCLPIVDSVSAQGELLYWERVYPDISLPQLTDWSALPEYVNDCLYEWKERRDTIYLWWQARKAKFVDDLKTDVCELSGREWW